MSTLYPVSIKGNPWRIHLKREGTDEALCGKKPGQPARGSSHPGRAGWNYYRDTVRPNCETCITKRTEMEAA